MTATSESAKVAVFNRTLASDVEVTDETKFKGFWSNVTNLNDGVKELDNDAFRQLVAKVAFGGIPDEVNAALDKLISLEAAAAEAGGVARVRKARAGVADTPYVVPDMFRAYKRIIKAALVLGVEVLDGTGHPLGKSEVEDKVKLESKSDKSAIEKLTGATDTFIKILAKCDAPVDKLQIEALRKIIDDAVDAFLS